MSLTPSFLVPGIAREMVDYYMDVFPGSELLREFSVPGPDGEPMLVTASLQLHGTEVLFINGGTDKSFTESTSLTINCADQAEVDHYWSRFVSDGGQEIDCGWCNDMFGMFWQVVPVEMPKLLGGPNPERADKAMEALMTMKKIDLDAMKAAMDS